jgi:hypothetical protein
LVFEVARWWSVSRDLKRRGRTVALDWHSYSGGIHEASQDETIYTIHDLGQNGVQVDIRHTGDDAKYPRLIVRRDTVAEAQAFAESVAGPHNRVNLPDLPGNPGEADAYVYRLDGEAAPR